MINPKDSRKQVHDFLLENTDIKDKNIKAIAYQQLQRINKTTNAGEITLDQLNKYISDNYIELENKAEIILNDVCNKLIVNNKFMFGFFKSLQFATISVLVFPALFSLGIEIFKQFKNTETSWDLLSLEISSFICLTLFTLVSLFEFIKHHK